MTAPGIAFPLRSLTVLSVLLLLAGTCHAQVNIGGPRTLSLRPGETRTVEYTIVNRGPDEVAASIFVNDAAQLSNGVLQHIPAPSLPQSLLRIAEFERLEYVLGPGDSAAVPLRITVPEDAAGGYWGVVGVETPPPPPDADGNAVMFNVRYAMVTSVEVEGAARKLLAIENVALSSGPAGPSLVLTIRNEGNVYQRFQAEVAVEGAGGGSVTVGGNGVVLPGITIDHALDLPPELEPGNYGVFAVVTYDGERRAEAVGTVAIPTPPDETER